MWVFRHRRSTPQQAGFSENCESCALEGDRAQHGRSAGARERDSRAIPAGRRLLGSFPFEEVESDPALWREALAPALAQQGDYRHR